jgi:acyl-CoA thioester hydrolase
VSPPPLVPRREPLDLSDWPVEHPRPFLCDLAVVGDQLSDTVAHVSNVEFVRWLDRAAELHADSVGLTRARLLDDGLMWFVARHEVDYRAEAHAGDALVVATWVRDVRRVKSWRRTVVMRPADGRIVCEAATLWVLVHLASRRPVRIPPDMASRLDPLEHRAPAAAGRAPAE